MLTLLDGFALRKWLVNVKRGRRDQESQFSGVIRSWLLYQEDKHKVIRSLYTVEEDLV